MQAPAPASGIAEPPPPARPQLARWICQKELRSVVLAAAAASTTTALVLLRLVTFGFVR